MAEVNESQLPPRILSGLNVRSCPKSFPRHLTVKPPSSSTAALVKTCNRRLPPLPFLAHLLFLTLSSSGDFQNHQPLPSTYFHPAFLHLRLNWLTKILTAVSAVLNPLSDASEMRASCIVLMSILLDCWPLLLRTK